MRRSLQTFLSASLLSALLLVSGCGNQASSGSSQGETNPDTGAREVTIGLSAPLTGNSAQYGKDFRNAITLAINEFNAKAGPIKVNLMEMDSKDDPKEAASIAQKLVDNQNVIAVIGDFSSTTSMAAAPIYQRSGLVQLSPSASHPDFTRTGDYIFRNVPIQEVEGDFVAGYGSDMGFKKMAVVHIQNDWGISAKDSIVKGFEKRGGEIVSIQSFNPGQKDFANILTTIRETKPDVLYLGAPYTESALVAQQARKLGMNVPLLGVAILYSDKYLELGGQAVERTYCNSYFFPDDPRPIIKNFVESYKKQNGKNPDSFAAQAYDSVNMILSIVEQGITDRTGVRDALAKTTDFPGVTGTTSFNENRDVVKEMVKLEVKDGQFILHQGSK
ncbi:ABC transporter substrate-binding protein [Brevibacillus sp. B_LB10_24]|uniref:ABC transporter substrate-binding protein n=1 Tax=Brevibacillus sp. B_LB10_24 TaxID=3380645 RepID=UPI0038B8E6FC